MSCFGFGLGFVSSAQFAWVQLVIVIDIIKLGKHKQNIMLPTQCGVWGEGVGGDHGDMACILGQVEASRDNRNSNSNNSKARKNNQLKWQKAELTTACLKCARQSFLPACLPASPVTVVVAVVAAKGAPEGRREVEQPSSRAAKKTRHRARTAHRGCDSALFTCF